ncbi:PaaX family transcriptional regulator C-terminal domain-containing protein [Arthrobacter ginkgonis]|uniref:PaaX family transcriptional regulator C-terminal domain-containing protein n=1 Tax=Arthrobacter ginkgonis TaxID=1630594 RepID=A0ABP7C520_9MICC
MQSKPLHQELVVTLYGLYARETGSLPVASLVALLADLGVENGAARSTVSRLKSKGVLERRADPGPASYSLSASVMDVFRADDARIFAPERSRRGDPWALVVFSVPEAERNRRYELRSELASLGFGFVAGGVAIAPSTVLDQAIQRLRERGLLGYIEYFTAQYGSVPFGSAPNGEGDALRERVRQWWDLEGLDAQYAEFIDDYAGELERWKARPEQAETQQSGTQPAGTKQARTTEVARLDETGHSDAFSTYVPLLTRWRRFPYRDPNIPLELLPVGWKAPRAKALFLELHGMLAAPAEHHARSVLASLA